MLFDEMAGLVDGGHLPDFEGSLRVASLIEVPPYNPNDHDCTSVSDTFRLPWNVVCLDDGISCVLIQRRGKAKRVAAGWEVDPSSRRMTTELGVEVDDWFRFAVVMPRPPGEAGCFGLFVEMMVASVSKGTGIKWSIGELYISAREGGRAVKTGDPTWKECARHLIAHAVAGLNQCASLTAPSNWIVKKTTSRNQRRSIERRKDVGIPRSHERNRWLLITDKERVRAFREAPVLASGGTDRGSATPHARRAHYRCIGLDGDGNKRHTWVKACWVGSTEAEIRGARYRVELGL